MRARPISGALALGFLLTLIYLPSIPGSGFSIDDQSLIHIPQLSAPMSFELLRTWLTPGTHIDFYPLRDFAYWVQIHVFAADPLALDMTVYRATNLATFTGILWVFGRFLERHTVSPKIAYASIALYALLPFHSELLMWASAQKDLLAMLFAVLASDQIDAEFQAEKSSRRRWIVAGLFFASSLLCKASFILLPISLTFLTVFGMRSMKPQSRRTALVGAAVLSGMGLAWAFFQTHIYQSVNDMRLGYPVAYRIQAAAAALGREVSGLFWPPLNSVDVENWGSWLALNSSYVVVGYALWAAALVASGVWLSRKKIENLTILGATLCLYLPTAGLIFQHRNFYSVRYFEPILLFLWPVLTLYLAPRLTQLSPRNGKLVAVAAIGVLLFGLGFSLPEGERWKSSPTVLEKSLRLHPSSLALQHQYFLALREEARWGRLTPEESATLQNLQQQIATKCTGNLGAEPNDDCLSYWVVQFLNPESDKTENFAQAAGELRKAIQRLLPSRMERLDARRAIIETIQQIPSTHPTSISALIQNSGFESTPDGRLKILTALCMGSEESASRRYFENALERKLLDPREVRVQLAYLPEQPRLRLKKCLGIAEAARMSP